MASAVVVHQVHGRASWVCVCIHTALVLSLNLDCACLTAVGTKARPWRFGSRRVPLQRHTHRCPAPSMSLPAAVCVVDRWGRRPLLLWGSAACAATLAAATASVAVASAQAFVGTLCAFIFFFR